MKVLSLGSLNLDRYYTVKHMVRAKETITAADMTFSFGGKGMDQAAAVAKAGVPVYLAGLVGEDGKVLIDFCNSIGVKTDYVETVSENTGHTVIQVDEDGQNCIIIYGGANRCFTKEYIDRVLSNFAFGDYILLQNEVNLLDYMVERAAEKGMKVILNPSPYDRAIDTVDMSKVNMLFLNEVEGELLTGEKEPGEILAVLRERYPEMEIVLTLGEQGAVYLNGDEEYRQEIYEAPVRDTAAAGDTFSGYFIAGIIEGKTVQEAMELAAKASAITITRLGTAPSIPARDEVETSDICVKMINKIRKNQGGYYDDDSRRICETF